MQVMKYDRSVRISIFFFLVLIVTFVSLGVRCFYLQYLNSDYYSTICIAQQRMLHLRRPQRGVILDCRGRVLAASNEVQTIFAEPRIIENPESVSVKLAPVLGMGAIEIWGIINQSRNPGFVKIKTNADVSQCIAATRIHSGIGVQSDWRRHYPMGPLAAQVVGFTGVDNVGLIGTELQYDEELSGSSGEDIFFADVRRRPIRVKQQNGELKDGLSIILTLDATIQQFARAELLKQYESYQAESAVAIVADPKTGAILAMVSLPDFDPDNISSADPNTFRNRVITDQFEPGSMIKPVIVSIAIDAGAINKDDRIFCENGNYYGRSFGRIHEYRNHGYGNLSIREVLIKSSNIGMAKIGQKLGKEKLYKGLTLFGFGKKTGVDLPGEVQGLLRPTSRWSGYSVTRIPYGYEINVTAMQMLRAFCILANGGRPVRPFLVKAIIDNDGRIITLNQPPPPVGFIVKPEVAKWIVNDCLVGVVNERQNGGTGWRAKLDDWQVFGKTGTANIARVGEAGYEENANIASFVAGAPADDPAIVVMVSIRRPNSALGKGDSGGVVASPVAARIIEKTLNYLEKQHR